MQCSSITNAIGPPYLDIMHSRTSKKIDAPARRQVKIGTIGEQGMNFISTAPTLLSVTAIYSVILCDDDDGSFMSKALAKCWNEHCYKKIITSVTSFHLIRWVNGVACGRSPLICA